MDQRHRFQEFYEAKRVERENTIAYVGYCMAKIHGKKPYTLIHHEIGKEILFLVGFEKDGETYLARFYVKPGWSGKRIIRTCGETVQALRTLYRNTTGKAVR